MSFNCTRCSGTGFLNHEQIPEDEIVVREGSFWHEAVLDWIDEQAAAGIRMGGCSCHKNPPCNYCLLQHDIEVCDCCGDGDRGWVGVPGEHANGEIAECA